MHYDSTLAFIFNPQYYKCCGFFMLKLLRERKVNALIINKLVRMLHAVETTSQQRQNNAFQDGQTFHLMHPAHRHHLLKS